MNSIFKQIATLACALALAACGGAKDYSEPVVLDPLTQVAELTKTDIAVGSGNPVVNGDRVDVRYVTYIYNRDAVDKKGTKLDAGQLSVPLGAGNNYVPGFEMGILGMRLGGKRLVAVPSALAYGPNGRPPAVPPNTGLLFEFELVSVYPK
ncbi:FKBP-type peptidyl-prolyl cis-trans isomerase [Massilia sp. YIM B04103]|uniref:FKBP-type peptidyl-prolyl cis-trans isomerase n=1 Tax=Massilia sp. YIM B04103 TaxID=2963106 RepID=UPI00210E589F|nr:FKBP-type peptidyl-prolyl cis-trans isomerase [Massilia sp. YIM B04103]